MPIHDYPSIEEVDTADHLNLAFWHRFLASPKGEEKDILDRIEMRFKEMGGMNPTISKQIGWE